LEFFLIGILPSSNLLFSIHLVIHYFNSYSSTADTLFGKFSIEHFANSDG